MNKDPINKSIFHHLCSKPVHCSSFHFGLYVLGQSLLSPLYSHLHIKWGQHPKWDDWIESTTISQVGAYSLKEKSHWREERRRREREKKNLWYDKNCKNKTPGPDKCSLFIGMLWKFYTALAVDRDWDLDWNLIR